MESSPAVQLRPVSLADADVIASWGLDEVFCRAADWTPGLPLQAYRDHQRSLASSPPDDLVRLAAVHEGEVVGCVDLHGAEPGRRELGYEIGPSSNWGRGLGLAVARAGLEHGFDVLGLDEVWAEALDANVASVRILQRLGMVETGRGADGQYLGEPTHNRQFALHRPPYPRRTERLVLRPLREQDVEVVLAYRNDPAVAEFQDWDLPVTRELVERHVTAHSGWTDIAPGEPRQVGIEVDGELAGDLYVSLDEHGGVAEIGFTLRPEFQGKGYAFEAAAEVVRDLVERHGCHRIFGQLSPLNERSANLLAKLGMHVESLAPKSYWCRGAWDDNLVYAMSDEEWRAARAGEA